ncbi:MAG: hypothetical protein AVDCRST_MAG35-1235, partial [uncultured Quadrisphaera sp.]
TRPRGPAGRSSRRWWRGPSPRSRRPRGSTARAPLLVPPGARGSGVAPASTLGP